LGDNAVAKSLAGVPRSGEATRDLGVVLGSVAVEITALAEGFFLFLAGIGVHLDGAVVVLVAGFLAFGKFLSLKGSPHKNQKQ